MSSDPPRSPIAAPYPVLIWREVRRLTVLCFPIVVGLTAVTLIGVVDTIMIAPLGTVPLAGASVTVSFLMIFYSGLYGYVSVIGVRMAEAYGRGSGEDLSRATRSGLILAGISSAIGALLMLSLKPALILIGQPEEVVVALGGYWTTMSLILVPFTLFVTLKSLFDAIDAPWIGVGLAFVAVFLNVPANWVLIHGVGSWEGFGLMGAGLASLLSESVSLILAVIIWRWARRTAAAREPVVQMRDERRLQVREGTVIAIGYVGEGGAYSVASLMMGWFGATALAATQIVTSVGNVLYMVPMGLSIAVSIRIGQAIGADEAYRLTRIGLAALAVIISWMLIVMTGVLLAGEAMSEALSDDAAVVTLAAAMFVVIAVMQIADGIQGAMLGASRGMTDNRVPVVITLIAYWGVALPLGYVLAFELGYGPNGIWLGYAAGLAIAATLLTRRFFRMARRLV